MPVSINGTLLVQNERGQQHTLQGEDFNIDYNVSVEERAQGQESIHEAEYISNEPQFSVFIDIVEYPVGAYNRHDFRPEGCTVVNDDNLIISVTPE